MAEGFARKYWGHEYSVFSAGTKKHGMNARAVQVMREVGVDLSSHFSKTTEDLPAISFDYVVTVCDAASEACPYYPGAKIVHVGFPDPPALTQSMTDEQEILSLYRHVRDQIEIFIKNMKSRI
jgi:arsenate reductase